MKVFRLVTRGTIEELKYLRQVYKTQLKSETIVNVEETARSKAKRLFRGVEGDKSRQGELFGLENLLKFKDGNFINYAAKGSESKQFGIDVHGTDDLLEQVKGMGEEQLDALGDAENIFVALARRTETKGSYMCPILLASSIVFALFLSVTFSFCRCSASDGFGYGRQGRK